MDIVSPGIRLKVPVFIGLQAVAAGFMNGPYLLAPTATAMTVSFKTQQAEAEGVFVPELKLYKVSAILDGRTTQLTWGLRCGTEGGLRFGLLLRPDEV